MFHRYLPRLLSVVLFAGVLGAAFGQDDAQPADEGAQSPNLGDNQLRLQRDYERFEEELYKLGEATRRDDPDRADLLLRTRGESRKFGVLQQMKSIAQMLGEGEALGEAVERQEELIAHLQTLLKLLQSEDQRDRLAQRIAEIEEDLKILNGIIGDEKDVRADTERGGDSEKLESDQEDVARDAEQLAARIAERNARNAAEANGESSGSPSDSSQSGDPSDMSEGEKSSGEPSESESGMSESDPKDNSGEPSESSEGEPSESEPSESKPSESKPSESESSEGSQSQSGGQPQQSGGQPQQSGGQPQQSGGQPQQSGGQPQQSGGQPQESGGDQQQQEASEGQDDQDQTPGREELERAIQEMEQAIEELRKQKLDNASDEQDQALAELEQLKAKLEEILRQLREEERKLFLTMLEARFQNMLRLQLQINAETVRLDKVPEDQRESRHISKATDLSRDQMENALDADRALVLLKEEGSSVAFPEAIEQMRDNMRTVAGRLEDVDTGETTQLIEQIIVETLDEMIFALQRELEKMQQQDQQQQQQQNQDQDPPLVDVLAELKMIRSLQSQINRLTRQIGLQVDIDQPADLDAVKLLDDLSLRQQRIQEATYDLSTGKAQLGQ